MEMAQMHVERVDSEFTRRCFMSAIRPFLLPSLYLSLYLLARAEPLSLSLSLSLDETIPLLPQGIPPWQTLPPRRTSRSMPKDHVPNTRTAEATRKSYEEE